MKKYTRILSIFALASSILLTNAEEKKKTEISLIAGGNLTDGNSKTENLNLELNIRSKINNIGKYFINAKGNFSQAYTKNTTEQDDGSTTTEKKKETTIENAKIEGRLVFPVVGKLSTYADCNMTSDKIADIDYRIIPGLGLEYYFIKNDNTDFGINCGLTPIWEKVENHSEYYTGFRFKEFISHKFDNGSEIWQNFEYIPSTEDMGKYFMNAEIGIDSPINNTLSLRVVFENKYDSEPASSAKHNDSKISAAIRIKL